MKYSTKFTLQYIAVVSIFLSSELVAYTPKKITKTKKHRRGGFTTVSTSGTGTAVSSTQTKRGKGATTNWQASSGTISGSTTTQSGRTAETTVTPTGSGTANASVATGEGKNFSTSISKEKLQEKQKAQQKLKDVQKKMKRNGQSSGEQGSTMHPDRDSALKRAKYAKTQDKNDEAATKRTVVSGASSYIRAKNVDESEPEEVDSSKTSSSSDELFNSLAASMQGEQNASLTYYPPAV